MAIYTPEVWLPDCISKVVYDDENLPVAEIIEGKGSLGYRKPRSRSRICLRI